MPAHLRFELRSDWYHGEHSRPLTDHPADASTFPTHGSPACTLHGCGGPCAARPGGREASKYGFPPCPNADNAMHGTGVNGSSGEPSSTKQNGSTSGADRPMVCLVTGGSGLVGRALQYIVENEPVGSRFGKRKEDERWIFLSSKDGDLR